MPDEPLIEPQIVMASVEGLAHDAQNAKRHPAAQVAKLAASIREFGFLAPVVVDGQGVIVAGHGRVLAARQLGLDRVPVIVAEHLSEAQRRAYALADNRIAQDGDFDPLLLKVNLEALEAVDFDLGLTGFDMPEVEAAFGFAVGYDPKLDPKSAAKPVTDADLAKAAAGMGEQFERKPQPTVSVVCPHCGRDFALDKEYL